METAMNNNKRNVHSSGPLGMLIRTGQIKKVDAVNEQSSKELSDLMVNNTSNKIGGSLFRTDSGIEFSEQELVYVDPKECESWQYANRQDEELGDMHELIESIKNSKQLQPALIRNHPIPHDGIKYEIIFGRRRHLACIQLGIPFLAIRKHIQNIQDAIVSQHAENKLRSDVSDYSNAVLYKRLLSDKVFLTEKELAIKLQLSPSSLNDIMAYSKIPQDIIKKIPNIHNLSKHIVVKIVQLLNESKDNHDKVLVIADQLGTKISSKAKLEYEFNKRFASNKNLVKPLPTVKTYENESGRKLFTLKRDGRGLPVIVFNKDILNQISLEKICTELSNLLDGAISKSGYPD